MSAAPGRDTSLRAYRARRDFAVTAEPPPAEVAPLRADAPIFVVQKHAARRAGLHWDFRLEHGGVLWSWAVRRGPSLDPAHRRAAAHVEDHPLDYAGFQGTIPEGQYGAGTVETWDGGTWEPIGDPEAGMRKGDLTFVLHGTRLAGRFHLVRLKPRPGRRSSQDGWLLFKGRDGFARAGADAAAIEASTPAPAPPKPGATPPAPGAVRGRLPASQVPQLAETADEPPDGGEWVSEIKFDGYRLLVFVEDGAARVITRNGNDWTPRLPALAAACASLRATSALLDGELVALRPEGLSSFPDLQAALAAGQDGGLNLYLFDLLHLDGWDLRGCRLLDRKRLLAGLDAWQGVLRYSGHHAGDTGPMRREACRLGLEGILCKRADAPYQPGRGPSWLKVKCRGREEFVVLGWTPPAGSRTGLGSVHLGYYDPAGHLHYAGGAGSGFSQAELDSVRAELDARAAPPPRALLVAGEPLERSMRWVRPDLVAEVQYTGWSGAGRVRQAVFLGLREDKEARDVVREPPDPEAKRKRRNPHPGPLPQAGEGEVDAPAKPTTPPLPLGEGRGEGQRPRIVAARAPRTGTERLGAVALTHPDRELWPGITKRDLAAYWRSVAGDALPGLVRRPLAIVRCPDGVAGEHFFQKHAHGHMPPQIHAAEAAGAPYLAIDDLDGLYACAQIAAIELHAWGAAEADPLRPDQIVMDLDPGEGVPFAAVVRAAHDTRARLASLGLESFPRTTGGKGLHVVVPLVPRAGWDEVRAFCHALAETMSREQPERFLSTVRKIDRRGRILIDWLRNGLGATAIASFCPRARPGARVATPLSWREVTPKLDPAQYTMRTIPQRLARLRQNPWEGFEAARRPLPDQPRQSLPNDRAVSDHPGSSPRSVVVFAAKPKKSARSGSVPKPKKPSKERDRT